MIPSQNIQDSPFKIYNFTREGVNRFDPLAIDDKKDVTIRFAEKHTLDAKGFKISTEIYESDVVTITQPFLIRSIAYNNLIKKIDISYQIGSDNSLLSRTEQFCFYRENGDEVCVSTKVKHYDAVTAIAEGVRRRHNVMDRVKASLVGLLIETEVPKGTIANVPEAEDLAKPLALSLSDEITGFIEGNARTELEGAIFALVGYPWLDNTVPSQGGATIRQILISIVNASQL